MRRAELTAPMSLAEMDRMDRDLVHYNKDEELDSRRFRIAPQGTIGVCIRRHDTDAGRPGNLQQPTSGTHAGEPTGTAQQPLSTTVDADA